ncbi:MAG: hypothetical protein L3K18_04175 [Thermoplasmata archaeon]|nr:hypothetical protein [Thermoplasmata archaeon]
MVRLRLGAAALLAAIVLSGILSLPAASGPHAVAAPVGPSPFVHPASGCGGPKIPTILRGTLGVEGTILPRPTVGNVTAEFLYAYETNDTTSLGSSLSCFSATYRAPTNASGGFVLNLTLPATSCSRTGCLSYAGPFGPYVFGVSGGAAPAYFLSGHRNGSVVALDWVAALASAQTSPYQFGTLSLGAWTLVRAEPFDGAGNPSTANLSYSWQIAGTGWATSGPSNGSTFNVVGGTAGTTGTVTLWVNGSYNHTAILLAPVHLYLTAVPTAVLTASVTPNPIDVGLPAAASVHATGAGGYAYSATLQPGGSGATQSTACATVPTSGGLVDITCSFGLHYPAAGTFQPTATVTNGFSAAKATFLSVVVSSSLGVAVGPNPNRAYAGTPVRVGISVEAATGTAPYGPACLLTGDGRFVCDESAGPNWTIAVSYASLGTYHATATVADLAGANRTVPLEVDIVAHPAIVALALNQSEVPRGASVRASATVSGGAFPLSYWWNSSSPDSTLASGEVASDQVPSVAFVTGFTAASEQLTLTVVDALGTVVANATTLAISRPITGLALVAPQANASTPAGIPVKVTVVGVDDVGSVVPGFRTAASVRIDPACGAPWVNGSSGPLIGSNGTFTLTAPTGSDPSLEFTVTATQVGACPVAVWSSAFPAPVSLAIPVAADGAHIHLVRPDVVRPGIQQNATLYTVLDRFGNADPQGFLIVEARFGSVLEEFDSAIRGGGGTAVVWVNYTSEGTSGGTLTVLNESNVAILGPLPIPALPGSSATVTPLAWVAILGAAVLGAAAVLVLRRRSGTSAAHVGANDDPDEPLRRLAEGRSHVLSRLSYDHDVDLDEVVRGFPGPMPDAAELAEWVGTLVTEGLVRASVGPDGRPMFRLSHEEERPVGPRVEVDAMALDAALARRDLDAAGDTEPRT